MAKPTFDIARLTKAMRIDRLSLQRYRTERREMVREYTGAHWSDEGATRHVPVNLIALYLNIVGRNMIAKNPRVLLSTFNREIRPIVNAEQAWVNKEIVRQRVEKTLARVVTDALFSVGFAKVALATPSDSAATAWTLKAGSVFCERVDLDDIVFDIHARDWSEVSYIGHRYRVPLDTVRDSRLYSKWRKDLVASNDEPYNLEGDERVNMLGRGYYSASAEEFEDWVDLWEVYLPRHRVVLTLANDSFSGSSSPNGEALREQAWIGPDCGPYHPLGYNLVPGNIMPKGPVMDLIDLHKAANELYRKLIRQAQRQKSLTIVQRNQAEDGERIRQGSDGDMVPNDDPQSAKQVEFGGPNQVNFQMAIHLKDTFDFMAGGLSLLGGIAPQSKTLGQDKMLNENASRQIQDMQATTVDYTTSVLKAMLWYYHHDPYKVMQSQHSLPGAPEFAINRKVTPMQRFKVPFEELDISVDPYSMRHQTPQERMAFMNQVIAQAAPMMQLFQAQGIMLDVNFWMKKLAEYGDSPDLAQLFTMREPPQDPDGSGGEGSDTMPASTERNYVRRSIGQDTTANRDSELMNTLAKSAASERNGTH